jgi:hypothetical protein
MLVSKEQFIYFLNKYKAADEERDRFHDALRPYFDFPVCTYRDDLFAAYEYMLVAISECFDEDGIFSWWLFESGNDNKIITVEHQPGGERVEYDVQTAEGLYNYLYDMYHHEDKV